MRLIDADELQKTIHEHHYILRDAVLNARDMGMFTRGIDYAIQTAPTIDAVPVRHGEWIRINSYSLYKCSACGEEMYVSTCMGEPMYAYCPNCGAKMDKKEEDDETD